MPLALIVLLAAPVVVVVLALYLSDLYGDKLFGLDWPGHDLNNPDDPRLIKLDLSRGPEQSERGPADRLELRKA